jgi:3-methyladenine DNA glycosylase AlkD
MEKTSDKIFEIKTEKDYENFVAYLHSIAKNESAEKRTRHIKIISAKKPVIFIATGDIRDVAKKIAKSGASEYLKLAKFDTFEETTIFGLVVVQMKAKFEEKQKLFNKFAEHIDCWAECDTVSCGMKIDKDEKEKYFNYFYSLCFSNKEFVARFGVVNIMAKFLDEEHFDAIIDMVKKIRLHTYYLDMAVAWLVSFLMIKNREKTLALLREKALTKFVQNKAICKCRDSFRVTKLDKELLIKLRIK